ncbi:MAG: lytic murein transglycosylase [Rhodobacteraceae bacterium]|nr:lytic murein transglycosylase [Paracoccaceae bacterium]
MKHFCIWTPGQRSYDCLLGQENERSAVEQVIYADNPGFDAWLAGYWGRATAGGIAPETLQAAFAQAGYIPEVIAKDRNQAEFGMPLADYLALVVSDSRIADGREMLARHAPLLAQIETRYGVEKEVIVAVWGMESAYGARRGHFPLISALATLAYDGRRGKFFERQLTAALQIVQAGDVAPARMLGSWAGAMGHTQFIPTSYLALAVDFGGEGRRDIWRDDPTDALASTAHFLAQSGWQTGQPWGLEGRLPDGFDYGLAQRSVRHSPVYWAQLGVRAADGRPLRVQGKASILLPVGAAGPAFMIFGNFAAIERYNNAEAYVIGIGHLSDRLRGGGALRSTWPAGARPLSLAQRREMQGLLSEAGYSTKGVDGHLGPNTSSAIRTYQQAAGLAVDGYASLSLLERLR